MPSAGSTGSKAKHLFAALILVVLGIALIPIAQAFITAANLTGATATFATLIPFVIVGGAVFLLIDALF